MTQSVKFPSGTVQYHYGISLEEFLRDQQQQPVILTDEHLAKHYGRLLRGKQLLVVEPGERSKDVRTIESLAKQLLQQEADRGALLIGLGGGVVTDIAGFLGAAYMRGITFGFVPTSLLAMVDAAIGGKNGVNVGLNKNILGTIRQPQFIVFDSSFLDTLPDDEWSNGFAEIIKYACIFDSALFEELERHSISDYRSRENGMIDALIKRCVEWKNKIVAGDETESGQRKLLNFGHTAAHAIENLYDLPHGKAVGIGMVIACMISERTAGLDSRVTERLRAVLGRYHLPVNTNIDASKAMDILKMDKKRKSGAIDYVVLNELGKASVSSLPLDIIENALRKL